MVQIAEDTETHQQYAIKFFVSKMAFEQVCGLPAVNQVNDAVVEQVGASSISACMNKHP